MKNKQEVEIIKDKENPIPVEIMEKAVVDIANAMKKMTKSRLNRRAIVTLVARECCRSLADTERVIDALERLEKVYLK